LAFDDLKQQPPRASLNPDRVEEFEAYAAAALDLSKAAAASCRTVLDIEFGDDYYQKLDLYLPDEAALADHEGGVPVILFCHGGGWNFGYKEWNGFMAPALIDLPTIFVSVSYRLAPEHKFPAALEDVLAGLSWVFNNIADHGGDPNRLFMGGWSAGGTLAALATVRRDLYPNYGLPDDVIKACVATSTPYDHRVNNPVPGSTTERLQRQLFTRPEQVAETSAIAYIEGLTTPFFISHGEKDFPHVMATSQLMHDALAAQGTPVEYSVIPSFDHYQNNLDQGRRGNEWVETVRRMILEIAR
jgi:arylformamidase